MEAKTYEIFYGDCMVFHEGYSMEFPWNTTTFFMLIPWSSSHEIPWSLY